MWRRALIAAATAPRVIDAVAAFVIAAIDVGASLPRGGGVGAGCFGDGSGGAGGAGSNFELRPECRRRRSARRRGAATYGGAARRFDDLAGGAAGEEPSV
jgi:hypothetical protein